MGELLKTGLGYFYPGDCYETVWENYDFFDGNCVKMFSSRFLSVLILVGAIIVKVPQIVKILSAGSVENLSYVSFLSELGAVTFTCSYNFAKEFPFSSWGESFFIAVQVILLVLLLFYFNNHMMYLAVFAPTYATIVWYLTSENASMDLLAALQTVVIPLILISRLSQVYTTFVNRTTGQLSLITSYLNWSGTAARIFTTMQETQDPIMLSMFITSFVLNSIIMVQFVMYWNTASNVAASTKKRSGSKKEKKDS